MRCVFHVLREVNVENLDVNLELGPVTFTGSGLRVRFSGLLVNARVASYMA